MLLLPLLKSCLSFSAVKISLDSGEQTTGKRIYNILRDRVLLFDLYQQNASIKEETIHPGRQTKTLEKSSRQTSGNGPVRPSEL